jgi:hypothetical protein
MRLKPLKPLKASLDPVDQHLEPDPMSFLKSLFGLGGTAAGNSGKGTPTTAKSAEHKGFRIDAQPYAASDGQFQVAGLISKEIDGARREHRFVRADRFATREDAADIALNKARQIIDQQGDRVFD